MNAMTPRAHATILFVINQATAMTHPAYPLWVGAVACVSALALLPMAKGRSNTLKRSPAHRQLRDGEPRHRRGK